MKLYVMAATLLICSVSGGQADWVTDRTGAMDQVRASAATLMPMIKGDADLDEPLAALALRMTYAGSIAFQGKFPDGSNSKGANPEIWTNKADFDAKVADFKADARHAVQN